MKTTDDKAAEMVEAFKPMADAAAGVLEQLKLDDGGPAFPVMRGLDVATFLDNGGNTCSRTTTAMASEGLSIRDYFAAKVMQGFCANPAVFAANGMCGWKLVNATNENLAAYCVGMADVLLAELKK
jgi:hypothetical protein